MTRTTTPLPIQLDRDVRDALAKLIREGFPSKAHAEADVVEKLLRDELVRIGLLKPK